MWLNLVGSWVPRTSPHPKDTIRTPPMLEVACIRSRTSSDTFLSRGKRFPPAFLANLRWLRPGRLLLFHCLGHRASTASHQSLAMRFVRRAVVASMQRMQSHLPAVQSALRREGTLSESAGPGVWVGTPLARPSVLLTMVAPLRSAGRVRFPRGLIYMAS